MLIPRKMISIAMYDNVDGRSPNSSIPIRTAAIGSNAPKRAVIVGPT